MWLLLTELGLNSMNCISQHNPSPIWKGIHILKSRLWGKQGVMAEPMGDWYLLMPDHSQVSHLNLEVCDIWLTSDN